MGRALRYAEKHPIKNLKGRGRPRRALDKTYLTARKEKYEPIDELLDNPIVKTLRILGHFTSCPVFELLDLIGAPDQSEDPRRRQTFVHSLGGMTRRGLIAKNDSGYYFVTWRGARYLQAQLEKAQVSEQA